MHDAAQIGDLEKVKALLKSNPDLVFVYRLVFNRAFHDDHEYYNS